jgi:DNA-binding NarL/FixJ family response regulator
MVRIVVVDDDQTIRMLLRRLLENHDSWEVCGEADNGQHAIDRVLELRPDLAIIDLAMPGMNGFQAAQEISSATPEIPLLLLSVQEVTTQLVQAARYAGFRGAVTKCSGNEVIQAAEALLNNQTFFNRPSPVQVA